MILRSLEVGPIVENCYVIGDGKSAVVIDPGDEADRIILTMAKEGLKARFILLTHAHVDHVGALRSVKDVTGAELIMHKKESLILKSAPIQAIAFGMRPFLPPSADRYINDGDEISLGSYTIKVLYTPGHSPGGVCYYIESEKKLFVGDCLFAGSIGRTDLPGGDYDTLINSIKEKLIPLGDDVEVYPGHGPPTTIGQERRFNPFL